LKYSTVLNSLKDTVLVEKYAYTLENLEKNFINIRLMDNCRRLVFPDYSYYMPVFLVYPTTNYTLHLTKKDEIIYTGNQKTEKITFYEYDPSVYKPNKITEITENKNRITEYKYGIENSSMLEKNMVSIPIKDSVSMGTTPIRTKETAFAVKNGILSPSTVSVKNGTNASEVRLKYENYDKFGNPLYIIKDDATKVVYLWGYNYQYPIAEIKNATYAQVTNIISEATMDVIAKKMAPTTSDMDQINNLRTNSNLKDAFVTTYWYKPLVGIKQVRDPSGKDIFFEYDTFNRLKETYIMESGSKKIVEGYDYYVKQ
jgi:hypothetical protein